MRKTDSYGITKYFEDFGECYKKYWGLGENYFINKGTREINRIHPYSLRETPTEDGIYDLIQAGMVEKVEEVIKDES